MTNEPLFHVQEMFMSIQGESTHAGRICFFIRLAGCNLRCSYCDTKYAQGTKNAHDYTLQELLDILDREEARLVEVTGGEPLCQSGIVELCKAMLARDMEVLLETNGSKNISVIPAEVRRIVDCKLPSSGMSDCNYYENYQHLTPRDEVKFVIGTREDYDFAMSVIRRYDLSSKTKNILFSPVWEAIEPETLVHWMIEDKPPARMQLQMQKIIWDADKRGV